LPEGAKLACPGARLKAASSSGPADISCADSGLLSVNGGQADKKLKDLSCSRSIREKVQHTEEVCGEDGQGKLSRIGWQPISNGAFLAQIDICHQHDKEHTHYAAHIVHGASMAAADNSAARQSYFKEGDFYDVSSADTAYKLKTQEKTLQTLLGEDKGSSVFNKRTSFLAKGHLAPDADFIYEEWQDATYFFANVAPQWQAFNNGNWKAMEIAVRDQARKTGRDLLVFTGTLGQLAYRSDSGQRTPLAIAKGEGDEAFSLIPVPEFYWKIVHDGQEDEAIVFVGLNDPHFEGDAEVEAQICPNVCEDYLWLFSFRTQAEKGFLYCCTYQDFKQAVPWVPDLPFGNDPGVLKFKLLED